MNNEFSDRVLNNIMKNTEEWLNEFQQSAYYEKLTKAQRKDAEFIIEMFSEWNYSYELRRPREWTQSSLSYVLLDPFTRKIAVGSSFFKHVEPVLTQYFLFLDEIGKIKNSNALITALKEVAPIMIEEEKEGSNWGIGKKLMASGEALGVNMEDEEELRNFIDLMNQMNGHF